MNIAFIGGRGVVGTYSGIETYYEEVGSRLVQLGHEVTVYCRSYFTPKVAFHRGMRVKRLPTVRTKHLETIVHSLLSTGDALFRRYDIVQFNALGSSPLAVVPRLLGTGTVVSVQGLDGERAKWGKIAQRYLQACEWTSARCPSATSVVSHHLVNYYAQYAHANIAYIPNGVTLRPPVPPNHLTAFGLGHKNYILFVGRLSPEKGCHYLIEAFKGLDTHLKLVFVGDSTYVDDYIQMLRKDESDRILFLGFRTGEILEELFSNAYFYVLPSTIEGLSISLLEAMSYGNCVVASDIPENLELVEGHGFTFRSAHPDSLKQTMAYLMQHPTLVEETGKAAKDYVQKNFTWDMIAQSTESLYKSVFQGG